MITRFRWLWAAVVVATVTGAAVWHWRGPMQDAWRMAVDRIGSMRVRPAKPDPHTYAVLKSDLERWRLELADRYQKARTAAERQTVEHDARVVLETALPAMMRCWLGTPWDFNGTATQPGGGKIACGYYVATVIKDAGFRVNRYQLARQPSGNILQSFLAKDACTLSVGQPYAEFAAALAKAEHGIYIVGLDRHVAFLVVGPDGFQLIHSSGSTPWCVVAEDREKAGVLQRSSWRMTGNLTADPGVLRHWLTGKTIEVRGQ